MLHRDRRCRSFLFGFLFALSPASLLQAQTYAGLTPTTGYTPSVAAPGTPAGSYILSGFDTLNLANGHVNFRFPLVKIGGTGRGDVSVTVSPNMNRYWTATVAAAPVSPCGPNGCSFTYYYSVNNSDWNPLPMIPGVPRLAERGAGVGCTTLQVSTSVWQNALTRLTATSTDGTETEFVDAQTGGLVHQGTTASPGYSRGSIFVSRDATSSVVHTSSAITDPIYCDTNSTGVSGTLTTSDGTNYTFLNGYASQISDRNGNLIQYSNVGAGGATITDPAGRVYQIDGGGNGDLTDIKWQGFGGRQNTITVKHDNLHNLFRQGTTGSPNSGGYSVQTTQQLWPSVGQCANGACNPASTGQSIDPMLISEIDLPDGTSYQFQYNSYADVARVILPTGAAVEYDYSSNPGAPGTTGLSSLAPTTLTTTLSERREYANGINSSATAITTYPNCSTSDYCVEVNHLDGARNLIAKEQHHIARPSGSSDPTSYNGWQDGQESEIDYFDSDGHTLLRKIVNQYQQRTCDGDSTCWFLQAPYNYTVSDARSPAHDPRLMSVTTTESGVTKQTAYGYDVNNNRTDEWDYDWGTGGSPGSLLRHTNITFTGYPSQNIFVLPSDQIIRDGSDAKVAETQFVYDNQTISAAGASMIGHDANFGTGFTSRGNLTQKKQWLGTTNSYLVDTWTYDIGGNVITYTDPKSTPGKTTFDYTDSYGTDGPGNTYSQPTTIKNALGQSVSVAYDYYTGKSTTFTDANKQATNYAYNDPLDRLTQIVHADGGQTLVTYPTPIQVVVHSAQITATDGRIYSETDYDGFGRAVKKIQYEDGGNSIETDKTYDALGRLSSTTNPYRVGISQWAQFWPCCATTYYQYDGLSRVQSVTGPDGAAATTSYAGNQTTYRDQASKARSSFADALGRLTGVVEDPSGLNYTTVYGYDALSDLVCVNQGGTAIGNACQPGIAHARSFYYDSLKRLVASNNPENSSAQAPAQLSCTGTPTGSVWSMCYGYDEVNLISTANNRSIQTNYTYDALNRILSKTYSDGTPQVAYTYDAAPANTPPASSNFIGHLAQITNYATSAGPPASTTTISTTNILGYDAMGRVTASSQVTQGANLSQPTTFTFPQYTYNYAGSLTSETLPSGRTVSITYDAANRPITLQGTLGTTTNYIGDPSVAYSSGDVTNSIQYVPHGAVYAYTRGDGITRAESYNQRLQSVESYYSKGNVNSPSAMLFVSCPHWGFGSVTIITAICPSGPSAPDNGNLIAYDEYLGAPGANSYTHFSQPSTNGAAISYDGVNRLTGVDDSGGWSRSFAYDQWGNMSIVPAGSSGAIGSNAPQAADASTLYNAHNQRLDTGQGYDATGNVSAMTNFSNISYDAESRLLTASSPSPFSYEYDGNGRRVTKTGNNNTTVYVYDAAGELAAEYNTASQPAPACTTCYLSHDYLGSVRMMTDASGTVISRHDLLPFGEEIPGGQAGRSMAMGFAGSTDGLSQKFTGKERDAESGLDYFGARYYGSALGRFTSTDPSNLSVDFWYPQSWNRYAYALNNPLSVVDRNGLWPTWVHNQIINEALPGLSKGQLQNLQTASKNVDSDQSLAGSYKHGMANGQDPNGTVHAEMDSDEFIGKNLGDAKSIQADWIASGHTGIAPGALTAFGNALHTITDKTSPSHEHFQPWYGTGLFDLGEAGYHFVREAWPWGGNQQRQQNAVDAARRYFLLTFGSDQAAQAEKPKKPDVSSKICYQTDNGTVCQ